MLNKLQEKRRRKCNSTFTFCTGEDYINDDSANKTQMAKSEISLTLSNKFEVPENEDSDMKSLLIRYNTITHITYLP